MWKVNPDDVERCVWDVVRVAKDLNSDESRYFRAVSVNQGVWGVGSVGCGECVVRECSVGWGVERVECGECTCIVRGLSTLH